MSKRFDHQVSRMSQPSKVEIEQEMGYWEDRGYELVSAAASAQPDLVFLFWKKPELREFGQ